MPNPHRAETRWPYRNSMHVFGWGRQGRRNGAALVTAYGHSSAARRSPRFSERTLRRGVFIAQWRLRKPNPHRAETRWPYRNSMHMFGWGRRGRRNGAALVTAYGHSSAAWRWPRFSECIRCRGVFISQWRLRKPNPHRAETRWPYRNSMHMFGWARRGRRNGAALVTAYGHSSAARR